VCLVRCVRSRPHYFAERLYRSMKGAGTDDTTLIRVVVSRCEVCHCHPQVPVSIHIHTQVDMVEIKKAFFQLYNKTLSKMIEGDCSGDYRKMLIALVGRD